MIYNQFSSNPLLGELPTSSVTGSKGTTYGYGGRPQTINYGFGQSRTFQPNMIDLAASQKSEFERLGGLQELQAGALQQQQAGLQLRQSQMELADIEEQRRIKSILDSGMPDARSYRYNEYQAALTSPIGQQYQLEKEKTQYDLDMLRNMRGGGFGAWSGSFSVPSFPSMR